MIGAHEWGVRVAASLLRPARRARFLEEWLGNLRDAGEIGLDRSMLTRAAFRFALSPIGQRPSSEEITMYNPRPAVAVTLIVGLAVAGGLLLVSPFMIFTVGLIPLAIGAAAIVASSILTRGRRNKLSVVVTSILTAVALAAEIIAVWMWGAAFEAVDANRSAGSSDTYITLLLVLASAALLGLLVMALVLHVNSRRYPRVQR